MTSITQDAGRMFIRPLVAALVAIAGLSFSAQASDAAVLHHAKPLKAAHLAAANGSRAHADASKGLKNFAQAARAGSLTNGKAAAAARKVAVKKAVRLAGEKGAGWRAGSSTTKRCVRMSFRSAVCKITYSARHSSGETTTCNESVAVRLRGRKAVARGMGGRTCSTTQPTGGNNQPPSNPPSGSSGSRPTTPSQPQQPQQPVYTMTDDEARSLAAELARQSASASLAQLLGNDFLGVGYAISDYGWVACGRATQSIFDCTYAWKIISGVGGTLECYYDVTFEKTGPSDFVYRNVRNERCTTY
jgi:hypothetical protein